MIISPKCSRYEIFFTRSDGRRQYETHQVQRRKDGRVRMSGLGIVFDGPPVLASLTMRGCAEKVDQKDMTYDVFKWKENIILTLFEMRYRNKTVSTFMSKGYLPMLPARRTPKL